VIPSLATPIGGLVAGYIMSRWGRLALLVRIGAGFMLLGNLLVVFLKFHDSTWKYYVYVFPTNLGQGIIYPSLLFTFLSAFEHKGMLFNIFLSAIALLIVADQATSTSTVYLIRSVGWVWGVAIVSAILQGVLRAELPSALEGVKNKEEVESCLHLIDYANSDRSLKRYDIRF
jgi:MFS family permease